MILERRILLVQGGEPHGDLVLVALVFGFERLVDVGVGIVDGLHGDLALGGGECVAGVGVLQLDQRADFAGVELLDLVAVLAVEDEHLPQPLGLVSVGVDDVLAGLERAGHHLDKGQFADVGLVDGLEDKGGGLVVVKADGHLFAVAVLGDGFLVVVRRGGVLGDEVHQPRHTDIGLAGGEEDRDKNLGLERLVQPAAKLLLGDALVEEFFQQRVVRLGHQLDQLGVQPLDLFLLIAGDLGLVVFAAAVGLVGELRLADHIQRLVEARAGIDRNVDREEPLAERRLQLLQDRLVLRILGVDPVDHHRLGQAELLGVVPHFRGADLDAVRGVDDDERQVGHLQRRAALGDEIQIARGVDDVETALEPLGMQQRCVDGKLPLLLRLVIVGCRGALGHAAEPVDVAGAG